MGLEESVRSIAHDLKGIDELRQYDSGDYDTFEDIQQDMDEEWEEYKQDNNLILGSFDSVFCVDKREGGILTSDRLSVASNNYIINFRAYDSEENSQDQMFEAEYLSRYDGGEVESKFLSPFFEEFLDDNFERLD